MYTLDPESYPKDGPEWLDPEEFMRDFGNTTAEVEEAYMREVAEVRKQFFGLLMAHNALVNGCGWAIFDDDPPGSVAELGARDVLLLSLTTDGVSSTKYEVPLVRIMANEPYITEDMHSYITEDVTVRPNGAANYIAGAVGIATDPSKQTAAAILAPPTPLFFVQDGQIKTTSQMQAVTPVSAITDRETAPNNEVLPFGNVETLEDRIFALTQAKKILDSIANIAPKYQMEM